MMTTHIQGLLVLLLSCSACTAATTAICPDGPLEQEIAFREPITALAVDPNTTRLGVGSREGTVTLVDLASETHTELGKFQYVEAIVFSPNGKTVAGVGGIDARVWDVDTGRVILEVEWADEVVFSATEPWLATCTARGTSSWSVTTGTLISTFPITCPIVFAPDGRLLGGSSRDDYFDFYRPDGTAFAGMPFDGPFLSDAAVSPAGTHIVLAGVGLEEKDGAVTIWELWSRQRKEIDFVARQITYSPEGDRLIIAGPGDLATIWSADRRTRLAAFEHEDEVWRAALSFSGNRLATFDLSDTITMWDVGSREALLRREQPFEPKFTLATTDDRMFSAGEGRIHVDCR